MTVMTNVIHDEQENTQREGKKAITMLGTLGASLAAAGLSLGMLAAAPGVTAEETGEAGNNLSYPVIWVETDTVRPTVPGVERCQVVNPDATTIEVRLDTTGGSERTRVEEQVVEDMDAFLRMNGVVARCAISADRPQAEPSGKVKQVISRSPVPAA